MKPLFYSADYIAAGYAFDTTRKAGLVADLVVSENLAKLSPPVPVTVDELCRVHQPAYVDAIRSGIPRNLATSQGFTWDEGLWKAVTASTGGVNSAAIYALKHGAVCGSLSTGLHHARWHRGSGFCTFNGLVVAAAHAPADCRVLILDLDAHCGGGTHQLVAARENVWMLDLSTHQFDSYLPTAREKLCFVEHGKDYLKQLATELQWVKNSWGQFDLILYNAGMDPCELCEYGGCIDITSDVLKSRESIVNEWRMGTPLAFVLAGGYTGWRLTSETLTQLHALTIREFYAPDKF